MIYYIVVFIALFASEWMYFIFAAKYHVIDKPNDRSSHAHVTLRGGGIIFPIAALIIFRSQRIHIPLVHAGTDDHFRHQFLGRSQTAFHEITPGCSFSGSFAHVLSIWTVF